MGTVKWGRAAAGRSRSRSRDQVQTRPQV